ncbi:MAG: nucleotidyltransferase domain-containing protein, partial [Arenicellales bacterium]
MPQRALRLRFDEKAVDSVEQCRAQLAEAKAGMLAAHDARIRPGRLLRAHSDFIDKMLSALWSGLVEDRSLPSRIALIAVGGYGRQELHPGSDIDLLILRARDGSERESDKIEGFIRFLWDVGLQVGHSTRTLQECVTQARSDITVVTNLMEARYLSGDPTLLERLATRVSPERMWSPRKFFEAKREEQVQRHQRYGETAYNLEPHVKEGPGGLRDIQTIQWVGHRYFGTPDLEKLSDEGFLTDGEVRELLSGRELLWRLRNGLHLLTSRSEDRLLFDYQREIASQFGYRDDAQLAVEKLMKRYFRTVKKLRVLNEIL